MICSDPSTAPCLPQGFAQDDKLHGRSLLEAPESDGCIWLNGSDDLTPGQYVNVRITGADAYDLEGEVVG